MPGPAWRTPTRMTTVCLAVCLAVVLAWFAPWWAGGRNLAPLDLPNRMMQPWRGEGTPIGAKNHLVSDAITATIQYRQFAEASFRREGELGWSGLTYGGTAQYADTMALYWDWTSQLHRWLGFWTAWHVGLLGQVAVAACGMALLLRGRGIGAVWAVCGALAYAANSQFVTWIYHRWMLGAFCWAPWIIWSIDRYRGGRWQAWPAVPALIAVGFLGGTLQHAAILSLVLAACWGEEAWKSWQCRDAAVPGLWRQLALLGRYSAWGLLACGLAGMMLLPCVDALATSNSIGFHPGLYGNSASGLYPEGVLQPLFHLAAYPLQVFPSLLGRCDSVDLMKLFKSNAFYIAYFGSLPVMVAFLAAGRRDTGTLERILILAGLLLPLTPAVRFLYQRLLWMFVLGGVMAFAAYMQFSGDASRGRLCRWAGWCAGSLSALWLLAGAGMLVAGDRVSGRLREAIAASGRGSSFGGAGEWLAARAERFVGDLYPWSPHQLVPLLLFGLGVFGLGWTVSRITSRRRAGRLILAGTVLAEVTLFSSRWVVWTDPREDPLFPRTPEVAVLETEVGRTGRVVTMIHPTEHMTRTPFVSNTLASYGIASINGFGSVAPMGMLLPNESTADAARLGRYGVTHLITWPGNPGVPAAWQKVWESAVMVLYRNPLAQPRYAGLRSEDEMDRFLRGGAVDVAELRETTGLWNRRLLEVPPAVAVVRVAENWGDGWLYRQNGGRWRKVRLADDRSMWLALDKEGGRVEMRYKPPLKTAGMWLSGSSLGVLGLCLPALWITHRK